MGRGKYLGDGFRSFVMAAVGYGGHVADTVAVEKVQFPYIHKPTEKSKKRLEEISAV